MPKKSMKQIEDDKNKVIQQLIKDSSQSPNEIAQKLGFSRQKVWRIIKNLEENHTIWGYHAVIDKEKLGLKSYIMFLKKTDLPAVDVADTIIKRVVDDLGAKIGINVTGSFYVYGDYDWVLTFTAENIKQANKFCEIMHVTYKGYIARLDLLEEIFAVKKCGIPNPNKAQLKEYLTFPI